MLHVYWVKAIFIRIFMRLEVFVYNESREKCLLDVQFLTLMFEDEIRVVVGEVLASLIGLQFRRTTKIILIKESQLHLK